MQRNFQAEAIDLFQQEIVTIYKESGLRSISGVDMDFMIGDRQVLAWFFDVVRKGQIKFKNINFHEVFDDIVFCSDEVLYHTALLILYAPYMNNPIADGHFFHNRMIYPNRQNLPSKRFGMHSNTAFEKVYNFWDRIGDLLAIYMPEAFPPGRNVYFGTAVAAIPEKYHSSNNFKWLSDFKNNEYKIMNSKRIDVVHYLTNDTAFRHKHVHASSNREALEKLISERDSLPEFFKGQLELCKEGFLRVVQLLEEITAEDLKEVN